MAQARHEGGDAPDDLLARLAALGVVRGVDALADATPTPRPDVLPIERAVPGRTVENELGRCYVSDVHKAASERHGAEVLDDARRVSGWSLALVGGDPRLQALDVERTAFLDTETTGLGLGAGTYAFLVGIGRFVGRTFQVRQLFMRDPSEEPAQLAEAAAWMSGCTDLVTFNGRSFDVPLLETRYAMRGITAPLAEMRHLDLLPAARRLWSRRLSSCTLVSLEQNILGLERQDDVPGWLIPNRYFDYQSDGDARPLVGIFNHNALDILSMVSLLRRMDRVCATPTEVVEHGADWLSLSRLHEGAGDREWLVAACRAALEHELSVAEAHEALVRQSLAAKRAGDWEGATMIWRDMVAVGGPSSLFAFEELAKYHEHRVEPAQLEQALEQATHARQLVESGALVPRRGRLAALADLDHRIDRLRRRLDRS